MTIKPIKAWGIVSQIGKIICVSFENKEDAWREATDTYHFGPSYADGIQIMKDCGYRCIRVTISPISL